MVRRQATRLLCKNELRSLIGQELVDWATQLLTVGVESPSVLKLAGLDLAGSPSLFEALPLFESAIEELGLDVPRHRDSLIRSRLIDISEGLLEGHLPVEEALARAHREVVSILDHPADLQAWCDLEGGLEPIGRRPLSPIEVEQAVRLLAKELIADEERGRKA
jgi:hypothetical protein